MRNVESGLLIPHSTFHIPHSDPMPRDTRRSGLSLILAALVGVGFFWITDPRWGVTDTPPVQVVDAIHNASAGTWVGIGGCGVIALIGFWLMLRRAT
jgi:hypothetical protein